MAPFLEPLLYMGFQSGLRFVTLPTHEVFEGQNASYIRSLLLSPSSRKMAKCLEASAKLPDGSGLPDLRKATISKAFGDLYSVAALNVDKCGPLEPGEFFGRVKEKFPWASTIPDDTLWAFTYRCFHAREIFKEVVPGWRHSRGQPLVEGLDEFRLRFSERYDVQYGHEYLSLPVGQRDEEKASYITAVRAGHLVTHSAYFPQELTCAEYDGDGTDRKFWHFQPGYALYRGPSARLPAYDAHRPGTGAQQAVAQGLMDEDGDANPDWAGGERDEEEEKEVYGDEDEDEDGGEDEDEGVVMDMGIEGGEDDVEMGGTTAEAPVVFSNLCHRPACHQAH